ncbi:UNVERIFIED_ORG: tRNA(Glu) U13 pseudouridine synthase TruD [Heyndrickxia coagulans]
MEPILKKIPQDFIVTECVSLPLSAAYDGANYHYYIMEKCGYTTFDAVELIACTWD